MKPWLWNIALGLVTTVSWASAPVADFHLQDTNPNSERKNSQVSPRDYLFQVSGYYFGDAG